MPPPTLRRRVVSGFILIGIYLAITLLVPRPATVKPEGFRLLGVFAATVAGLILQPIPGGALVLIAVTLASVMGGLTIAEAMGGFGDSTVWLVMAAFFISTAMIKTGFARRVALIFVRTVGGSSLGVSYALIMTDVVLATIIPSNGARSGGVVLPIARSIAQLYGSEPGPTAGRIGAFLMTSVYQGICVSAAMFMTGQASNPLVGKIANDTFHFPLTWVSWFVAGLAPGLCSLFVIPIVIRRMTMPELRRTPEAVVFARNELIAMGAMDSSQRTVLLVFLSVCGLWITSPLHNLDIAIPALLGSCVLLVTGVLSWEDVVADRIAWDIFIWYGGLLRLGKALNEAGVTTAFAKGVGGLFPGEGWVLLFAIALLVNFYAHYALASITAHILAMFTPFCAILVAKGAPLGLTLMAFACFTNFSAGLTNYGTTPSPMFFATNYVSFRDWWRAGFVVSLLNVAIWSTIGFTWWKLIGIW